MLPVDRSRDFRIYYFSLRMFPALLRAAKNIFTKLTLILHVFESSTGSGSNMRD